MRIGHIYKKGKSYYLCLNKRKYNDGMWYWIVNIMGDNGEDGWEVNKDYSKKYTHIGKAIDLIRGGE